MIICLICLFNWYCCSISVWCLEFREVSFSKLELSWESFVFFFLIMVKYCIFLFLLMILFLSVVEKLWIEVSGDWILCEMLVINFCFIVFILFNFLVIWLKFLVNRLILLFVVCLICILYLFCLIIFIVVLRCLIGLIIIIEIYVNNIIFINKIVISWIFWIFWIIENCCCGWDWINRVYDCLFFLKGRFIMFGCGWLFFFLFKLE